MGTIFSLRPNDAIASVEGTEKTHGVVDLVKALEDPHEILGLVDTGGDSGDEPLQVRHLGHLRGELLSDGTVGIEHIGRVEALIDLLNVARRAADPLTEETLVEGDDAPVEQTEKRAT